jgi:subtilisin family serine protease
MKFVRFMFFSAILLFAVQSFFTSKSETQTDESGKYVKGELLVKFKNINAMQKAQDTHAQIGATLIQEFSPIGWQHIHLPDGVSVDEGIKLYKKNSEVEEVQPNFIYSIDVNPNDPRYVSNELYGMTKINAPTAWDTTTGSASVVVAVIDTGVNYNHEDLTDNMWRNPGEIAGNSLDDDGNGFIDDVYGRDFINNDSDPMDDNSHGSHCAGTIGATGNNSIGVVGVNWSVKLMALKTHANNGNSTAAAVIAAFQYATMMKNRGVNIRATSNSWSGAPEAPGYDQALKDAIDAAGNAGILNVFAAGNGARNIDPSPEYPASYNSPSILAVAASDQSDNKAGFSNYGVTSVDIAAPGVSILSTVLGTSGPTAYGLKSGTSMATPHTAGAAALLAAANPSLSMASLKATLMNSVNQLAQWNGNVVSGGRLNIANAIQNQTVCNFNVVPNVQNIPVTGGNAAINVTCLNNCGYAAVSNASWITISSGNPGAGNGTINYSVAANPGPSERTGTIAVAGQTVTVNQAGPGVANRAVVMDFDGDGKSDYAVTRNQNGTLVWYLYQGGPGFTVFAFGFNTDVPVPEDYDGDRKWDFAVYRPGSPGLFYIWQSSNSALSVVPIGNTSDDPRVTQDYDGDGKADPTTVKTVSGQLTWQSYMSMTNTFVTRSEGAGDGLPIRGDFDGDGKADLAYYSGVVSLPQNTFFMRSSSSGNWITRTFGLGSIDYIVSGDFDTDGKTDVAVWRGKTQGTDGTWWWMNSSNNAVNVVQWGIGGYDVPVPGDYDGDGRTDVAIWRPDAQAAFYANRSTQGFFAFYWGFGTDTPPSFGIVAR